eukprot:TRINITY_DN5140_c0_g1_i1.p1 TRINITY_DN5140_c0_g1~~TRINITY_DN5140_c0_g1_i1.p1  ORF type:complete len:426 (-),score=61.04 TRINITY_DN5140_c0_g1_i1:27-1304(-)
MKTDVKKFLAVFVLLGVAVGKPVTINNLAPRLDVNGNIIDAHDGSIQKFSSNGPYFYHAAEYGLCKEPQNYGCDQTPDHCGFHQNHNISIWTSPDLSSGSWQYAGNAIDVADRPAGIVYRPHAVYNPNTKLYVLWWNYDTGHGSFLAAATSPSPSGPFVLQNPQVNITRVSSGDFALFVDDDGSAYVIYSWNYVMSIDQLTPDFLYSNGQTSAIFSEYFVEAPAFFKRQGIYYALFDWCCCYCYQGSGIRVHTAKSPLGPWVAQARQRRHCLCAIECVLRAAVDVVVGRRVRRAADSGPGLPAQRSQHDFDHSIPAKLRHRGRHADRHGVCLDRRPLATVARRLQGTRPAILVPVNVQRRRLDCGSCLGRPVHDQRGLNCFRGPACRILTIVSVGFARARRIANVVVVVLLLLLPRICRRLISVG